MTKPLSQKKAKASTFKTQPKPQGPHEMQIKTTVKRNPMNSSSPSGAKNKNSDLKASQEPSAANKRLEYEDHEIAACWRLMNEQELAALGQSILANGLRFPITLYEGRILDGRSRFRACKMVGVEPSVQEFHGTDPLQFAIAANAERRHDTKGQRALVAAKLANLKHGSNQFKKETSDDVSSPTPGVTIASAAAALKVSTASVDRAHRLLSKASPEIIEKVETGELTITKALSAFEAPKPAPVATPKSKVTAVDADPPDPSTLAKKAMRMLWSIPVGGLSHSAYKEVRDYLLHCYGTLKVEENDWVASEDDAQDIAKKVVDTLRLIPEGERGRRDAFEEMYCFICKACPDISEKQ